jgi:hypothetical protein
MKRITLLSILLSSFVVACGGGTPTTDASTPRDAASDSGPTCANPGFVCCTVGSTMAQAPGCENDIPVCPTSNPPSVPTPGTTCPGGAADAGAADGN